MDTFGANKSSTIRAQNVMDVLNKLAKWRVLFAGWQLGTRPKGDPECDAVSDMREAVILMRVELNALAAVLIEEKVITQDLWDYTVAREAETLNKAYEEKFPGVTATPNGLSFDQRCIQWMKSWKK